MEKKQKKKYAKIIILGTIMLLLAISMCFTSAISSDIKKVLYKADVKVSADDLVVHFIDVGQGDAIALRLPNEQVVLIDAGPKESQNKLVKYIKDNVLKSNNYLTIDYLVLTHPDTDHSGGISAVFGEFSVKNFYRPNVASNSENGQEFAMRSTLLEYDEAIKISKQETGITTQVINQYYELQLGRVMVQIFPPVDTYSTTNEMSPIVKVTYLNRSFLFTGDIQGDSESDMINQYGNQLNADVLKVAHHGSKDSTSAEFVSAVSPKYAIICVGNNNYGHPHLNTITRLQDANVKILTTERESVVFVCGEEMFGVLKNKIHSFEFVDWWVIGLFIELILGYHMCRTIFVLIKDKKEEVD